MSSTFNITIDASVAVYFNDPDSGGYQEIGSFSLPLDQYRGHGFFLLCNEQTDSVTAVLCRTRPAGNRTSQFNVSLTWRGKDTLPLCYLQRLKRRMADIDEFTDTQLSIQFSSPSRLPDACPPLMAYILQAFCEDNTVCVVQRGEFTEAQILDTISRLPIPDNFSIALPCPEGAPPCRLSLLPGKAIPPQPGLRRIVMARKDPSAQSPDSMRWGSLAESICGSDSAIVNLALRENSLDIYTIYQRIMSGRCDLPDTEAVRQRLSLLLNEMEESAKDALLMRLLTVPPVSEVHRGRPKLPRITDKVRCLLTFLAACCVIAVLACSLIQLLLF